MIIAVIGSRMFNDYEYLKEKMKLFPDITKIVSGGAIGTDKLAEKYAEEFNLEIEIILPDWKKQGKAAGVFRNKIIVDKVDLVVAFWDEKSAGTRNSINYAKKMDKKVSTFIYKPV
jgi:hypothetical protein